MNLTNDQLKAELELLRAENAKLKAKGNGQITFKVSEKGAISAYGLGRFPVTLYKSQWERLSKAMPILEQFINQNVEKLADKEKQGTAPVTPVVAA